MSIQLDSDQLKGFIKEQVRQVLAAHAELQDEAGVTILPRFKMRFSAQVVAPGGLNALQRNNVTQPAGDRVTLSEEQPFVEKTSRNSRQTSDNKEANKTAGKEGQVVTGKESASTKTKAKNDESADTHVTGKERNVNRTDSTNHEETDVTDSQKSTQAQNQGTVSTTETEFSR